MAPARDGDRAVADARRRDFRLQPVLQARFVLGQGREVRSDRFVAARPRPLRRTPAPTAATPSENDLAYAKAAAALVLARTEKDASQPWENPRTGARGTVTPIADAYTQDGFQCRDFLASYIRDGAESWLQGDACRAHQGQWTVRKLRPLKRS